MKHNWTFEEDYTCCMQYLRYIFDNSQNKNVASLTYNLSLKLPSLERGSIRMKLQNIKQICMEHSFNDEMDISPLENYSRQCLRAFVEALKDYNNELKADLK